MLNTVRHKLLLFFILLSAIPILVVGHISYQSQKNSLTKELEQNLYVLSQHLSREMEFFIKERMHDLSYLATNPVLTNVSGAPDTILRVLEDFQKTAVVYDSTIFVNTQGIVLADTDKAVVGKDLSNRGWFEPALQGYNYFSDIYYSPLVKRPVLVLAAPMKNPRGEIVGIVSPSIDLNHLWLAVDRFYTEQRNLGLSGYAFILNKKGDLIAYPDRSKILKENYFATHNINLNQLRQLVKSKKPNYQLEKNYIVSFVAIKPVHHSDSEWFVGVALPNKNLYQPLTDLIATYIITFGLLLLIAAVLALYISRTITNPIEKLVAATRDLGAGKKITPLQISNRDEIGKLAETFNIMVSQLEERKTEKRLMEQELMRSENLKVAGELAAGVAHEVRNPLTTIRGFLQLMSTSKSTEKLHKQEYIEIMITEIDRINQIITDFLTLSKPQAVSSLARVSLNELIDELLLLQASHALIKNIDIERHFNSLPSFYIDAKQLKQVFLNITQNAFESMPNGGTLSVSTDFSVTKNIVSIAFKDTGRGMEQHTIERLGRPFFTTRDTGTGLGLMLCYRIIQNMKGTLTVQSQLGVGTTFIIKLPVTEL